MNFEKHIVALLIFIFLFCVSIQAQNLVPNGSFEQHLSFELNGVKEYTTQRFVTAWRDQNHTTSAYCHKELIRRYGYDQYKWGRFSRFDTSQVLDGDAMIKLHYVESCPVKDTGCTGYLTAKLISPLEIGEVYEVSMWVFPERHPAPDTAIFNLIGMYLTRYPVPDYGYSELLPVDYFFGGKVIPGQWTQIKWYIRALCSLEHITIGMFRDSTFKSLYRQTYETSGHWFFIDNVSIVKVDEAAIPSNVFATPYCEYFENQHKQHLLISITSADVHFPSNQFELDEADVAVIDSFYLTNEERTHKVFLVFGHTDNQLAENLLLSQQRANSVKEHLIKSHGLPAQSILTFGMASAKPKAGNATVSGRNANRRVTIRTSYLTIPQLIYRQGLDALRADSLAKANAAFVRWIRLTPKSKQVEMLTDPRLQKLKRSSFWKSIVAEVRKGYAAFKDSKSAFYLDSLYFEDQRYRTPDYHKLSGIIEEIDTIQPAEFKFTEAMALQKDSINLLAVLHHFEQNGYPAISAVGRRAARGFGYVILHCGAEAVYEKFIPIVEQLCKEGEAQWDIYAMMCDKHSVGKGEPQKFGTQYQFTSEKQMTLYKVDNWESMNARRIHIGLTPISPDE